MKIEGWNSFPSNSMVEFDFTSAPFWLKALALTAYFERFAYPLAIKRGFGTLRFQNSVCEEAEKYSELGWKIVMGEKSNHKKFREGSLAVLQRNTNPNRIIPKGFALTRLGRRNRNRKNVHKMNGTYDLYKSGSYPEGL